MTILMMIMIRAAGTGSSRTAPRSPATRDAAFVHGAGDAPNIYFLRGADYWRFDPALREPVGAYYPLPSGARWGLPPARGGSGGAAGWEGAFRWQNGKTYFFRDGQYYRYNDAEGEVDKGFPRSTAVWWFGC